MAALERIAPHLGAVLASHVAFQLMDRRRLRPPDVIQRDSLMRVAAEAFDFEIEITGVERVPQCRRGLGRSLKAEHALVPGYAGEPVGSLACFRRPLCRTPGPIRP
jgi:hypothetical protein